MSIITLTTEWNKNDYYIGAVKGAILGECSDANVLDISHSIPTFSYVQAAFILRSCYKNFPAGTIHIIGVKTETTNNHPYLAIEYNSQFFIVANNGITDLIFGDKPKKIISIDIFGNYSVFPELDIFAKAACFLAKGNDISKLGEDVSTLGKPFVFLPAIDDSSITGTVVYIDSYKNAITNITESLFNDIGKGRQFEIFLANQKYKTKIISKKYSAEGEGEIITLFNSLGLLEIAIYNAAVCDLLSLELNSSIRVKFNKNN